MSRESCIAALKAEGIELDDTQLEAIADTVENTIDSANARGEDVFDAIQKSLDEWSDQAEAFVRVAEKNAHLNFIAQTNLENYINEHWSDAPWDGLRTVLTGVQADRVGAKNAVSVAQYSLMDNYVGNTVSQLNTIGPDGRLPMEFVKAQTMGGKNKYSDEVFLIMYHMNQNKPDVSKWAGKPASMVKAAEILLQVQEAARKNANDAGSHHIAKLENRVLRRTHDMEKIREHGYETWKKDMEAWGALDDGSIPRDKWDEISLRFFNQTITGERTVNPGSNPEATSIPAGLGNISKSMAHQRVFRFRDADAELAYHNKYSQGDLIDGILFGLEISAQRTGLMRRLGPNAKQNFDKVKDKIAYNLSKGGDSAKYDKFIKQTKVLERDYWPLIDGNILVPENAIVAKAGAFYRAIKMMTLLGKVVLTSIVDVPIAASEVKYHGGSFMGGMMESIGSLATKRTPDKDAVLKGLGVIASNMRGGALSRFDVDQVMAGGMSRMTELYFNLNGLTPWTDRLATGFALARSNDLAGMSNRDFKALTPEWQRILSHFEIGDAEWRVLKRTELQTVDGKKYMSPEEVQNVPDAVINEYLTTKGMPVNKVSIRNARNLIDDRFKSYFHSRANTAALKPDAGTRGMMLRGTRPGSVEGELARMVGMFKSFPAAIIRQVAGRDVRGHRSDLPTTMQAMKDPTAMMNMARLVATTTAFGGIAIVLKDIVDGRKPPGMTDETFGNFLLRAMLAGGALSIYGDFLIGEAKNRYGSNAITTFLGPAAQDLVTLDTIRGKMMSSDPEIRDAGADMLKFLFRNVPGSNLFYTKAAYDYLVVYNLMEMTDPGSLQRMEQRKFKQMGTEFIAPPSQVIPTGGGLPNF